VEGVPDGTAGAEHESDRGHRFTLVKTPRRLCEAVGAATAYTGTGSDGASDKITWSADLRVAWMNPAIAASKSTRAMA